MSRAAAVFLAAIAASACRRGADESGDTDERATSDTDDVASDTDMDETDPPLVDTDTGTDDTDDTWAWGDLPAAAKLIGEQDDNQIGRSVAIAGDVDADGTNDIVVAAAHVDDDGGAYIVSGAMEGTVSVGDSATARLTGTHFPYWGEYAGETVDGAGDTNGDGFDDVLVAAPDFSSKGAYDLREGQVYLLLGPVNGARPLSSSDAVIRGDAYAGTAAAGTSISAGGDNDGDGLTDILVGASAWSAGPSYGAAYLLTGPVIGFTDLTDGYTARIEGDLDDAHSTGTSVAWAGDQDGDGLNEVLVGSRGRAALFVGPLTDVLGMSDADATFPGAGGEMYCFASSAGDTDGDGYTDIWIPHLEDTHATNTEVSFLLFGGPATGEVSPEAAVAEFIGPRDGVLTRPGVGDLDGDGRADAVFAFGAYYFDDPVAGEAYVVYGPFEGARSSADADLALDAPAEGDSLGASVDVGDLDGDDRADILLGAQGDDEGGTEAGAVWLILGSQLP